jgi:O-antigen/teichoic acid export membrane protein
MQLRKHFRLLSWTAADKLLFVGYGFVTWLQIRALSPEEYGLAAQLLTLQAWIAIIAEGSVLQGIIQYGQDLKERGRTNALALSLHTMLTLGIVAVIVLARAPLSRMFNEHRFQDVAFYLVLYCIVGIPRSFMLKLLQRELRIRDVFMTNGAWLGTNSLLTVLFLLYGWLTSFETLVFIACSGMFVGSLVGILLGRDLLELSLRGHRTMRSIIQFSFPQALMMTLATSIRQLDIFLVQIFFSTRAVGVYNAAKMLYRVFETGADATTWLLYPTAVQLLHQERRDALRMLISKALILQLIIASALVTLLEFGGTTLLVQFLGLRYQETAVIFNVMAIGALALPFVMLQSVELALNRVTRLLTITALSVGIALIAYLSACVASKLWLVGTGVVAYAVAFALLLVMAVRNQDLLSFKDMQQAAFSLRASIVRRSLRPLPKTNTEN